MKFGDGQDGLGSACFYCATDINEIVGDDADASRLRRYVVAPRAAVVFAQRMATSSIPHQHPPIGPSRTIQPGGPSHGNLRLSA
jgi:hypothetical protein